MPIIQEVFLETNWDGEAEARAARNDRLAQLQAQGLVCTCENLYNVADYRVFIVSATAAEVIDPAANNSRNFPEGYPPQLRPNISKPLTTPRSSKEQFHRGSRPPRNPRERRIPYEER